jgi:Phage integrase, N-terminal SAM-like domain/Arm DNA-binding domain
MSMGSVRKRGKTWTWYLDIGPDPLTGRRRQTSKGGFKTKKAAQEDLNTAIAKRQRGELAKRSKRTVRDFLEDEWLPTVETTRRPSTAANYRTNVKVHVVPLIGDIRLQALTPVQLNAFYAKLQADHRRDGQPLAPKSVRNIHAMLHKALKDALRWGLVTRNVADAVDAPNGLSPEMHAWTAEQLRAFLAHARRDRLFAAWMLFATTGMRRGEVAGLRDLDLDLAAGWVAPRRPRVVVNHQVHVSDPKTVAGRPACSPSTPPPSRRSASTWSCARPSAPSSLGGASRSRPPAYCSPRSTARPCIRTASGSASSASRPRSSGSSTAPAGWACRRSGSMTCATPTQPSPYRPACRSRWSASASATPRSR